MERKDGTYDELEPIEWELVHADPHWICELIKQNRPYSLTIFPNPDVFNAIVSDQISKEWSPPTMDLLDFTANLMEATATEFIEGMSLVRSLPFLANYLIEKSSDVVESIKEEMKKQIDMLLRREQRPFTQNDYLRENLSKLRSERLKEEVLSTIRAHCGTGSEMKQICPDDLLSAVNNDFDRNQKMSLDDHLAEEMQNDLNAYGKVVFKRFIDNVPMIWIGILENFPGRMNELLYGLTDDEINQLVSAPADVIKRKNELKDEVATLESGINTIKCLSRGGISI